MGFHDGVNLPLIPNASAAWHSQIWKQCGELDVRLYYAAEFEYWMRVARFGFNIHVVDMEVGICRDRKNRKGLVDGFAGEVRMILLRNHSNVCSSFDEISPILKSSNSLAGSHKNNFERINGLEKIPAQSFDYCKPESVNTSNPKVGSDHTNNLKYLFIAGHARSGSTYFCSLMSNIFGLRVFKELFHFNLDVIKKHLEGLYPIVKHQMNLPDDDNLARAELVKRHREYLSVLQERNPNQTIVFKVFPDHLPLPKLSEVLEKRPVNTHYSAVICFIPTYLTRLQ